MIVILIVTVTVTITVIVVMITQRIITTTTITIIATGAPVGRGDDKVGNPHRAQIYQFELFELKYFNSIFSSLSSY